ncbi:MAG: hypothetical protein GW906_09770 [Epsilonproteobacteria bacterium]|nr:hypothetical protein [Campylobacterota bacterium]OIO15669.1 MAG: hypothetical protein AUJ81_06605 [Helicobacteraceae bacterium CG1_02_36_14]PIP11389.1 MAG: hypothetical protein COX50_00950 [Sulfurimonas sp. CG23_combo_of_CG06-09_8_20_14_all_36_33]PIS23791.1 MAG: hypothetical protein COT46_11775 [Sulfurimonas sp. CG08_land_8_20_14_0_20_36_33]PIU34767.1 MAG: hypothetical protein COT05_06335 [Sulfurimonas sp. CG07_land_8_20_14_0_80_36_56]PIV05814.1 MAG: hypothetical protein COS56_00140 [Sulfur
MKFFIISLSVLVMFTACATKNAFSKFEMTEQEELSISNLQSSKIMSGTVVKGVLSAVYLNEVYPNTFTKQEYFLVYLYQKEKQEMYNPNLLDDIKLTLKLNSQLPLKIKQLPHANNYSHLIGMQNDWNRYYLVAFEESTSNSLSLSLESGQFSSVALIYQKGEQ